MDKSNTASQEDLKKHKVPLGYRDRCSGLLIPLNLCRRKNFYLPWECEHERHVYEKCQYDDFIRRTKEMSKQRQKELEAAES